MKTRRSTTCASVLAGLLLALLPSVASALVPAPTVTFVKQPASPTQSTSAGLEWTTTGSTATSCRFDGRPSEPCGTQRWYTGLALGPHSLTVTASNIDGTASRTASWTVVVPVAPPTVTFVKQPATPTQATSAGLEWTTTGSTATTCRFDGGASAPCGTQRYYTGLALGSHSLTVAATNAAGTVSRTANWTVVTPVAPPTVTFVKQPANPTQATTAGLEWATTGSTATTCRFDGRAAEQCGTQRYYTGLALGSHSLTVTVSNTAGTVSRTAGWTVVAPVAAPTVTFVKQPTTPTQATSAGLEWTTTGSTATTCRFDGGASAPCGTQRYYTGLAFGTHTLLVTVSNTAGTAARTATWTVVAPPPPPPETSAPTVTLTSVPAPETSLTTAGFDWTAAHATTTTCRLDGAASASCAAPQTRSALSPGTHTFTVTVTNVIGSATDSVTWTVAEPGPSPMSTPGVTFVRTPPSSGPGTAAILAWSAPGATAITCRLDAAVAVPCGAERSYTGLAYGPHTFTVTATNGMGSTTATASWTVTSSIYWGALVDGGLYGFGSVPWDTRGLDLYEEHAGKKVSIVHFGQPWYAAGRPDPFHRAPYDAIRSRGSIPLVDWGSWDSGLGGVANQPAFTSARILDGTYDAYIRSWATGAKAWGHPFFLRFNWEMNGTWFPWGEGVNGNTAAGYVEAWRHVHDIFRSVGANNVTWAWVPNAVHGSQTTIAQYYPGDAYVDWVGVDAYNWGVGSAKPGGWRSLTEAIGPTYNQLGRLAPTKPIMIGEVGSTEFGGSKAAWTTDALETELPRTFPNVKAVVWFNWSVGGMDWPIETSASSQAAFAAGTASPYYAGARFGALSGKIGPL